MEKLKWIVTGVLTCIGAWLGNLAIPAYLLLASMTVDYITGIRAAKYRGQKVNSERGFHGLEKKVFILVLVGVGSLIDILIDQLLIFFNIQLPFNGIFAIVIAIWLTVNEIISILENLKDIGVPVPSWLEPLMKNIKSKVEEKAPKVEEESNAKTYKSN